MRNLSIVVPAPGGVAAKHMLSRKARRAGTQSGRSLWIPAFAGMTKVMLLATFVTLTLAACGRKDVPDYPKDAIDRPGSFDRTQRNQNPRYY